MSADDRPCSVCGKVSTQWPPATWYCPTHRRSITLAEHVDLCPRDACLRAERERLETELRPRPPVPDQVRVTAGLDCERLDQMAIVAMKGD